jgi:hypothetical protein
MSSRLLTRQADIHFSLFGGQCPLAGLTRAVAVCRMVLSQYHKHIYQLSNRHFLSRGQCLSNARVSVPSKPHNMYFTGSAILELAHFHSD